MEWHCTIPKVATLRSAWRQFAMGLYKAQISTTDYIWYTLHGNSRNRWSSGKLLHDNCRNLFFKNMRQIWTLLWYPRMGGGGWKTNFVLKISSFKFSEICKSVAQGVLKVSSDTIIGWRPTLIFKLSKMKLFKASQSSVVHVEAVLTSNQSPI